MVSSLANTESDLSLVAVTNVQLRPESQLSFMLQSSFLIFQTITSFPFPSCHGSMSRSFLSGHGEILSLDALHVRERCRDGYGERPRMSSHENH